MPRTLESRWKSASTRLHMPYEEYASHRLAGEKWCPYCQGWLPTNNFYRSSNRCISCNKQQVRVRRLLLRAYSYCVYLSDSHLKTDIPIKTYRTMFAARYAASCMNQQVMTAYKIGQPQPNIIYYAARYEEDE